MMHGLVEYNKKLIKILSEEPVDRPAFRELCLSVGVELPVDEYMIEIIIHKMRVNAMGMPVDIREESKVWLLNKNFSPNVF